MNQKAAMKLLTVQEALLDNPEYRALLEEHEILNTRFLETVEALEESQRSAIFDYLGLLVEMHTKQLEQACK